MTPLRPDDPDHLGGYRLIGRLGEGGMGTVYLARDSAGRHVAVKVIRPELAAEEAFRARFRSEVERARQVPPFCTAEVLDADPAHRTPYLVVEFVDGPSLADVVLEQGPLRGGALHTVAVGVAVALSAIHGAGVVHRDLKPRNVLLALGSPKVIDFGIAQAADPQEGLTGTGEVFGTVSYMAPERFEAGQGQGPAVDVFAWGAVVAYAGTGRSPFGGDTPAVTAARILTQEPRLDGLPADLAGLVRAALAKDPADRPSAAELLEALLSPGGHAVPADLRSAAEGARRTGRSRRGNAVAVLGGVVVAALLVGVGLVLGRPGGGAANPAAVEASPQRPGIVAAEVAGPAMFDTLQRSGLFAAAGDCGFDGGLRMRTFAEGAARCGFGPSDVFPAAQTLAAKATLLTDSSCVGLWFRVSDIRAVTSSIGTASAYRVTICPTEVALGADRGFADGDNDSTTYRDLVTAAHPVALRTPHDILITADATQATVRVDGVEALRAPLTEPDLTSGAVLLGAVGTGGPAEVVLTDLALRSGTVPGSPPAPTIFTTDGTAAVRVWYHDEESSSAVLEPVELLSGAEYCSRTGVAGDSARCGERRVPLPGGIKMTMPLADGVTPPYSDGYSYAEVVVRGGRVTKVSPLDLP